MLETTITTDDGAQLWVRDTGPSTKPAVLCCHGGPGIADYLEPVEAALGDAFRIIRWDQRGSGRSSASGPFTIERFVADVDAVRAAAGVERVVMFGHSWGANLAALYGQYHPARLDGLVYVSGIGLDFWPDFSAEHKRRQVERLGPAAGPRLAELRTLDRSAAEEVELRMLYVRSELHDVTDVATATLLLEAEQRYPTNLVANAALNEACKQLTVAEQVDRLGAIECPVLVIHGASDPRPVAALETMIAALRDVTLLELTAAGHNPWVEQPALFAAEVRRFVSAVS